MRRGGSGSAAQKNIHAHERARLITSSRAERLACMRRSAGWNFMLRVHWLASPPSLRPSPPASSATIVLSYTSEAAAAAAAAERTLLRRAHAVDQPRGKCYDRSSPVAEYSPLRGCRLLLGGWPYGLRTTTLGRYLPPRPLLLRLPLLLLLLLLLLRAAVGRAVSRGGGGAGGGRGGMYTRAPRVCERTECRKGDTQGNCSSATRLVQRPHSVRVIMRLCIDDSLVSKSS